MQVHTSDIAGLLIIDLDVHGDARGWFKENWQREKMTAAGLPDFGPVQNNISFNATAGTTRGLHAEPWDKYVSVATGRVFGAWIDLREGSTTYGQKVTCEIGPDRAVFVPHGVANGFQALEPTAYIYLVNAHWSPNAQYSNVNLREIDWPFEPTEVSEKDLHHPALADATPVPARRVLVTGADGQLGRALRKHLPDAEFCTRAEFDITNPPSRDWSQYSAIVNAAAYNDVNGAEHDRSAAWRVNAEAPARLSTITSQHNLTLVHVSTDYVFDGTIATHTEDETPSPVSAYGASKAAGETAARTTPRHYVVRTSWVFGDGNNFMRIMASLAERGVEPRVVNDQRGRPTSADDLARGIVHLLASGAEYGVYNITSGGDPVTRDEMAMAVFIALGHDPAEVHPVSTAEYAKINGPEAPRPAESALDLTKIEATGFTPTNWRVALALYVAGL